MVKCRSSQCGFMKKIFFFFAVSNRSMLCADRMEPLWRAINAKYLHRVLFLTAMFNVSAKRATNMS